MQGTVNLSEFSRGDIVCARHAPASPPLQAHTQLLVTNSFPASLAPFDNHKWNHLQLRSCRNERFTDTLV